MLKNYCKFIFILTVMGTAAVAAADRQFMVTKEGNVYKVYDPQDQTTVWVRDVAAYVKHKYRHDKIEGFGGKISNKEFEQGATPVTDAANAAANTLSAATGAAHNVANRVPSWRKYTAPLRAVFGMPKQRSH